MMTQPFLITGLPRSRTAWLSAVCNLNQHAICHHEPIQNLERWDDAPKLWLDGYRAYTGISDSSLGFHAREIIETYQPNTVIVLRDIDEVVASLAFQNVQARNYCSLLKERLQPVLRHPLVMTVGFDELRDPDVVCEVLQWLMPGGATDREKVAAMCMFNIQVDIDLILDKAIAFDPEMLVGADVVEELRAMA